MSFCFNYNNKEIEENLFLKKYKIGKYDDLSIDEVRFININSVQNDKLFFTNKLERIETKRNNNIKKFINDLILKPEILNDYFEGVDINQQSKKDLKKLSRVDDILKLYDKIPNNELVYKYAPNNLYYKKYNNGDYERGFQLLFTHKENIINIYLIDLYHLVIPSKNQILSDDYERRKRYNKDISECLFEQKKELD